jgi:predicted GIY-YIG superfamily endonuclease
METSNIDKNKKNNFKATYIMNTILKKHTVYLLQNTIRKKQMKTYIGYSCNLPRRVLQHNGKLKGGAKYTTRNGNEWKPVICVTGFLTHNMGLSFEWHAKRRKKEKYILNSLKELRPRFKQINVTTRTVSFLQPLNYKKFYPYRDHLSVILFEHENKHREDIANIALHISTALPNLDVEIMEYQYFQQLQNTNHPIATNQNK